MYKKNEVARRKEEREVTLANDGIFVFKDMDLSFWSNPWLASLRTDHAHSQQTRLSSPPPVTVLNTLGR